MVGRSVLVPGDKAELTADSNLKGAIELSESAANLKVNILDASGQLVKELDLGNQQAGVVHFDWDGVLDKTAEDGSALQANSGLYTIQAQSEIDGKTQAVKSLITDNVQSVSLGKPGEPVTLHLANAGSTSLAEIKQIM